ncbi:MAG: hypothetical protein ACR2P1_12140, partial [Pseudomonadales bacterium]
MKTTIFGLLMLLSGLAIGDVLVVNIWDPMPGKGALTFKYAHEARAIHDKLGAQAIVATDQMGNLHYASGFASWEAWGKFQAKLQASEEWTAFIAKLNSDPSAERVDV